MFPRTLPNPRSGLNLVNGFNRQLGLGRAYLNLDGDPVLEAALHLEGGALPGQLVHFLKGFNRVVQRFVAQLLAERLLEADPPLPVVRA